VSKHEEALESFMIPFLGLKIGAMNLDFKINNTFFLNLFEYNDLMMLH